MISPGFLLMVHLLHISFGKITNCPSAVCMCTSSSVWNCAEQNITSDQLKNILKDRDNKFVKTLILSDNNIGTVLLEHFQNFTNLEILDLGGNQLSSFPKNISSHLPSLKEIILDNNKINSLYPEDLLGYQNIQTLDLFRNRITELPKKAFSYLINVEKLYLEQNQISKVSVDAFEGLKKLKLLTLQQNDLTEIPIGLFNNLTHLTDLWLSYNSLESIPGGLFKGLKLLQNLYLNNADLTDDKIKLAAFCGLELINLVLTNNQLTTLKIEWFGNQSTAAPSKIYLGNNMLNCDCFLYEEFELWRRNLLNHSVEIKGVCKTKKSVLPNNITEVLLMNVLGCTVCSTVECHDNAVCVHNDSKYSCICPNGNVQHGNVCRGKENSKPVVKRNLSSSLHIVWIILIIFCIILVIVILIALFYTKYKKNASYHGASVKKYLVLT